MTTITITLTDSPSGRVQINTDMPAPAVGRSTTPATSIARDLIDTAIHMGYSAVEVTRDATRVPAGVALARDLLDAEMFAHAVPAEVRARARTVLGITSDVAAS